MSWSETIAPWRDEGRCFAFMKGRAALYAILRALGLGEGDEVLLPGFTCVVVPAAICYTGATPVFYDVDPATYNGDPAQAEALISPRTRAVIVQHTFGTVADLGNLASLCRERGIPLIEDCAHALGASQDGMPVGLMGSAAFASLQWSKPTTTGLGGLALIGDEELRESFVRVYRDEFAEPPVMKAALLSLLSWGYRNFFRPGLYWLAQDGYRWAGRRGLVAGSSADRELLVAEMPPDYLERFGRVRQGSLRSALAGLPRVLAHRTRIAALYAEIFTARSIPVQRQTPDSTPAHLRFPLEVANRPEVLRRAREYKLEIGDWFNAPLHPAESDAAQFGWRPGLCPESERLARRMVNLPTHPRIDEAEARRHADFLLECGQF